jgi:hypothetical protein
VKVPEVLNWYEKDPPVNLGDWKRGRVPPATALASETTV